MRISKQENIVMYMDCGKCKILRKCNKFKNKFISLVRNKALIHMNLNNVPYELHNGGSVAYLKLTRNYGVAERVNLEPDKDTIIRNDGRTISLPKKLETCYWDELGRIGKEFGVPFHELDDIRLYELHLKSTIGDYRNHK